MLQFSLTQNCITYWSKRIFFLLNFSLFPFHSAFHHSYFVTSLMSSFIFVQVAVRCINFKGARSVTDSPVLSMHGESVRLYLRYSFVHPRICPLWCVGCPSPQTNFLYMSLSVVYSCLTMVGYISSYSIYPPILESSSGCSLP
jgi:hypothetical protein